VQVLVTGGHGFIGTHLVQLLLEEGASVRCLYRRAGRPESLDGLDVEIVRGDIRQEAGLAAALRGVDEVYHLAGLTSALTPRAMQATNAGGTRRLMEAAARAGVSERFVHCSSLAAVGPCPPGGTHHEGASPAPLTWYGQSKRASEEEVRRWSGRVPWTILRPPGVYGPRDAEFLTLFQAAARGWALVPGRPDKRYSLIHGADLARALLAAARTTRTIGKTYFAAHPEVVTLDGVVSAAELAVGRKTRRVRLPESFLHLFGQVGDLASQWTGTSSVLGAQRMLEIATGDWVCSSDALTGDTGWSARFDLRAGFAETLAWYREEGLVP
jgi:dihydroflavonol-4-reductase